MIRNCQITDSPAIQKLNKKELGYNYPLDQTTNNLANILNDPQHHWLLVFMDDKSQDINQRISSCWTLWNHLFGLYVQYSRLSIRFFLSKKGISRQLMQTIEKTAQSLGIKEIRLNSSTSRPNAHQFYENIGYTSHKIQKRFGKKLD